MSKLLTPLLIPLTALLLPEMLALLTMSTDLIGSLESASSILMVFWCRQLPITHRVLLEAG